MLLHYPDLRYRTTLYEINRFIFLLIFVVVWAPQPKSFVSAGAL